MTDDLEARLRAVERVVVEDDSPGPLSPADGVEERVAQIESRLDELDERTLTLQAATRSLEGLVGNLHRPNRTVERRTEAAQEPELRQETSAPDRPSDIADEETEGDDRRTSIWLPRIDGSDAPPFGEP